MPDLYKTILAAMALLPASPRRCAPAHSPTAGRDPLNLSSKCCLRCGSTPAFIGVCGVCWHLVSPELRDYAARCFSLYGIDHHATKAAMRRVIKTLNESPNPPARAANRAFNLPGGSMQGTTGITENIHTERLDVGPFKYDDIELITKKAVNELGMKWDDLLIGDQRGFLDQAIVVLTGTSPTGKMADSTSGYSKVDVEFRLLVLEGFKNSPKWDTDEFARGWTIQTARGTGNLGAESEAQSSR